MVRSPRIWFAFPLLALLTALGCAGGTAKKPDEGTDPLAKVSPDTKTPEEKNSEENEEGEGVGAADPGKVVTGPGGRKTIKLLTPQGHQVELPADHDPWADRVVSFTMGKPAAKICTDPATTLHKPDHRTKPQKLTCLAMGHGGVLVLEFVDNRLIDGPGDDLVIFEVGPAVEPMDIEISENGKEWIKVGQMKGAKCVLDIGPAVSAALGARIAESSGMFRFVKITDAKSGKSNRSKKAGADVDAVGAMNSVPAP